MVEIPVADGKVREEASQHRFARGERMRDAVRLGRVGAPVVGLSLAGGPARKRAVPIGVPCGEPRPTPDALSCGLAAPARRGRTEVER